MDGLFYLMSIVAIGLVMWWVFENDAVLPDRPTKGFFAMTPGSELAKRRGLRAWISSMTEQPVQHKPPS